MDPSETRKYNFKVPKTKENLVKEILKRWWYAKDFQEQAMRCNNFQIIEPYLHPKNRKHLEGCTIKTPYKGR